MHEVTDITQVHPRVCAIYAKGEWVCGPVHACISFVSPSTTTYAVALKARGGGCHLSRPACWTNYTAQVIQLNPRIKSLTLSLIQCLCAQEMIGFELEDCKGLWKGSHQEHVWQSWCGAWLCSVIACQAEMKSVPINFPICPSKAMILLWWWAAAIFKHIPQPCLCN